MDRAREAGTAATPWDVGELRQLGLALRERRDDLSQTEQAFSRKSARRKSARRRRLRLSAIGAGPSRGEPRSAGAQPLGASA